MIQHDPIRVTSFGLTNFNIWFVIVDVTWSKWLCHLVCQSHLVHPGSLWHRLVFGGYIKGWAWVFINYFSKFWIIFSNFRIFRIILKMDKSACFLVRERTPLLPQYNKHLIIKATNWLLSVESFINQVPAILQELFNIQIQDCNSIKIATTIQITYMMKKGKITIPSSIRPMIITSQSEIQDKIQDACAQLLERNRIVDRTEGPSCARSVVQLQLHISTAVNNVLGSISYEVPEFLAAKKCIRQINHHGPMSFGFAVLAALYPVATGKHYERAYHYEQLLSKHGLDQLNYPVKLGDLKEIEKKLQIGFNVFSFTDEEGKDRYIAYLTKGNYQQTLDLLFWNGIFGWITSFSRFMSDITKDKCKNFFCTSCYRHYRSEEKLLHHQEVFHCMLPSNDLLSSINGHFIFYSIFEYKYILMFLPNFSEHSGNR